MYFQLLNNLFEQASKARPDLAIVQNMPGCFKLGHVISEEYAIKPGPTWVGMQELKHDRDKTGI